MTRTAFVVTACVIILGIYDLYAVSTEGMTSSISRYMQNAGFDAPFIVFTIGFICGHIFGYMKPLPQKDKSDGSSQTGEASS